jgi:hypothetical protein
MNEVCSNGIVSGSGGCLDFGSLLLSLGITIILVGALFYYVRQRFEVLEVSHKEQIGVMQNFIASIGDQFQRMQAYIESKVGLGRGGGEVIVNASSNPSSSHPNQLAADSKSHLINVSDDDDASSSESSYGDDDSETSDTSSERGIGGGIKIYDDDDDGDEETVTVANVKNPFTDNIKIIELNNASENDDDDDDDDDDDEDDDEDDDDDDENDDDENDDDEDIHNADPSGDGIQIIHVIKSEDHSPPQNMVDEMGDGGAISRTISVDLNVSDLGLELFDQEGFSPTSSKKIEQEEEYNDATIQIGKKRSSSEAASKYAQVSIKQLRQMVKQMDAHKKTDTSKLKREQLIAMLTSE